MRLDYPDFRVIICDNHSVDGSLNKIKEWADDTLAEKAIQAVTYREYSREEAEAGGDCDDAVRLVLIRSGANLGFAGGNNVGIRYALRKNDMAYLWLLNNDTVADQQALSSMVQRMRENATAGMCGSTLLYYHKPTTVQALGGATYNKWLGISRHIGAFSHAAQFIDREAVERQLDYLVGASLLVSKSFVNDVGLMNESYFLYFEELDWVTRAKGKYKLVYAPDSIVFHKEGASIGTSSEPQKRSPISDYYGLRSRVLFTKNYYKYTLPVIYLGIVFTFMKQIFERRWDRLALIIRAVREAI
jgi:Predicted glycosyltransferases